MKEINKTAILDKKIIHQGIGGREINIEKELTLEEVESQSTIAAFNFFNRRPDLLNKGILTFEDMEKGKTFEEAEQELLNTTCYYGHVDNLGYFVCEDELEWK